MPAEIEMERHMMRDGEQRCGAAASDLGGTAPSGGNEDSAQCKNRQRLQSGSCGNHAVLSLLKLPNVGWSLHAERRPFAGH